MSSEPTISLGKVGILDGLESNELDHFGVLDLEVGCRTCLDHSTEGSWAKVCFQPLGKEVGEENESDP